MDALAAAALSYDYNEGPKLVRLLQRNLLKTENYNMKLPLLYFTLLFKLFFFVKFVN